MRSRRLKHRTAKKYHEGNSCNSCNAGIWNSGPFFGRYPYLNHKLMGVGQRVLCQGQKLQPPDTKSLSWLYKWSGAQIQSLFKATKNIDENLIDSKLQKKNWKDEKTWSLCHNKNDRRVMASSSSVPVFCLTLHATSTFCAVRTGTGHSMCQKSGPTAALAEALAIFLVGHIWHDAKDLSFSRSVKGIQSERSFFGSFLHTLISLFHCYFTFDN